MSEKDVVSKPKISELAALAQARVVNADSFDGLDCLISAVSLDSASVAQGELFAALPGTRVHGAQFAGATQASAILTDAAGELILAEEGETRPILVVDNVRAVLGLVSARVYNDPSAQLTVLGVTGTSGKTTTSYLLEAGLLAAGKSVGLIGTTGTRINRRSIPTSLTTPEAPTLQALFAQMVSEGVTHVVMEVSSHALSLGRVQGVKFDVAGFSNLSQDHLDFHPTMEEYFEAKAAFFRPGSPLAAKAAVVCTDDQWGVKMLNVAGAGAKELSTKHEAFYAATDVVTEPTGAQRFRFNGMTVALPLPGLFNVANASLALAMADCVGVDLELMIAGLADVGVPGRMERIDAGQDFLAVVDYAHKPAAVAAVLDTVRAQVPGRVAVVIGCGGDRDASKRPIMGAEAAQRADFVVVTDDNPRSEDPAAIRQAVLEGARSQDSDAEVVEIGDRREAIRAAIAWAKRGDVVVVAGKGHEVGQLIAGVNHHFDDREEVRAALEQQKAQD
ncbi:UDP-N-acetylmuramoyl-L-alanyl-D-glutamate--2,6-diaminopimelate ligase [Corynebacterium felinum]|uniref:UDP-N-acetylmuramoyl-L-alanyl-D-glutamate--2,6-diaminopimelate ligase n=1 Tax=Corynebacterium felinum TaxID=131318 RepID=A0ABU2BD03_9CORY|nr:UDP-N-acetylmuramoyl-L-alanyl-D-glutamate--2,6-diaminopimelate ligase [Corynebacterium felinum]MDF5820917.1 UDP-N-acetylmuramoyl-L-alanyl-D-glutamate--2,6-diaminopimelate ligase [Corynebacterium felinum]MDR7356141.1 UDP-N-acetylmuramoyl-L-alanyl-D-glutamate--2,6-diaminopimelate ligase [Corynebacterium felinum]WJY95475.1 UDP-N-acetylmuramoyl-L-alanyl-D-glutamate--2,6-diaminopimelate ligase [Corynebacterium felinum]